MKKEIYILFGLVAVFSFALVSSAQAGTLTNVIVTPGFAIGGTFSSYTVSFKVASSTEIEAQIRLIFPNGFNVSNATATSTITASSTGSAEVASSTISGQEITLWLADGGVTPVNETIEIAGIPTILSPYAGASYTLGVETRTLADGLSDSASSTAFVMFTGSRKIKAADTLPPISNIKNPIDGLAISAGKPYTIKGTGVDDGNSTVDLVEISLDGGQTWSRAFSSSIQGDFTWKYIWENPTAGDYTVQIRATDARGNIESPSAGVNITVVAQTPAETPATTTIIQTLQNQVSALQQTLLGLLQQLIQLLQAQL